MFEDLEQDLGLVWVWQGVYEANIVSFIEHSFAITHARCVQQSWQGKSSTAVRRKSPTRPTDPQASCASRLAHSP